METKSIKKQITKNVKNEITFYTRFGERVTISVAPIGSEQSSLNETLNFANELSLWLDYASDAFSSLGREALAKESHSLSSRLYDVCKEYGLYDKFQ